MPDGDKKTRVRSRKLFVLGAVICLFTGLAALIVFLARAGTISVAAAILMLIALVGIYFGFGILIAAHLMVRRLE